MPVMSNIEKVLIRDLKAKYNKTGKIGRPVRKATDKVLVQYGLTLIQILDLDERNQVLTTNVWSRYVWIDELLKWNPKRYSDIKEVRLKTNDIWTPDIVLYNYADERMREQREVMVVVEFNGRVSWFPPAIFKSTCRIDIGRFPFDEQVCHMKFGSWTYDGFKLDIHFFDNRSEVNMDAYTESNEWQIIDRPAKRTVTFYNCCVEPYPDLTFYLRLKRNPVFYGYLLVLPCLLLSSLTLVIFWLPPESPAKMVLGMNIFVAFFLLLILLAQSTPSASKTVPFIGYYYCLNMLLITLSSFLAVVVINLYFRCDKRNPMPYWLKRTVDTLAKCFCMKEQSTKEDKESLNVARARAVSRKKAAATNPAFSPPPGSYTGQQPLWNNQTNPYISSAAASPLPPPPPLVPNYEIGPTHSTPCAPGQGGCYRLHGLTNHVDQTNCWWNFDDEQQSKPNSSASHNPPPLNRPPLLLDDDEDSPPGSPPDDEQDWDSDYRYSHHPDHSPLHLAGKSLEPDLREMRRSMAQLMNRLSDKDRGNRTAREWRMVALVLDRIFFWCYLVTILVAGLVLLLPREPHQTMEEIIEDFRMTREDTHAQDGHT